MKREDAEEYTQALGQVLAGGWRQRALARRLGVPQALGMSLEEWTNQRLGGYVRESIEERREAVGELVNGEGISNRDAAEVLGVDEKTVRNDLRAIAEISAADESDDQVTIPADDTAADISAVTREESDRDEELPAEPEPLKPAAPGWHDLGDHRLYCGDSTDAEFIDACQGAAFAFADPPYNAGKAEWDHDFTWRHDYLADAAAIVAVTPGLAALAGFLAASAMPYRWSIAAEITNGMTSGALRFGNWICVTLFAHGSIYRKSKDHVRIPAATGDDQGGSHASRKPLRLLTHLIELFTTKGDTIIDPFLGSGTTLIAAERTGRRCIGAEIDPMHCAEIIARFRAEARPL